MKKRVLLFRAIGLATPLLITGCLHSLHRADAPDLSIPTSWTANLKTQDKIHEAWLEDFNSAELNEFITLALAKNPGLQAVASQLHQSIAEAQISGANLKPSASLGLNGIRQKISTFGPQSVGGTKFDNYDLSLSLNWEVDLWGRLKDQVSGSIAQAEASEADYYAARLSLVATVTKSWFQIIEAAQLVKLAEKTTSSYRANSNTLKTRYKKGLTEGLDLKLIRTQEAFAEADLDARKRSMDRAKRSLETLLGTYPSASIQTTSTLPLPPAAIQAGQPIDLLTRRPDLAAAERRLAATESNLSAAKKERLPQISLTASGGTSSQEFKNLLNRDFSVWSLGSNLTQPIIQGGRIRANIERETAIRAQAEANYRQVALQAFFEVETTLTAEAYLLKEYQSLTTAANEADSAETLAWSRYKSGTSDFLTVLDAQRSSANAQGRLISLRSILLQNRVDLYLALGGSFFKIP